MDAKKVMLAVMSALLIVVIVMTGILISRVSQMFQGVTGPNTVGGNNSTTNSVKPSESGKETDPQPSQTETQPTPPETTIPTEPGHIHEYVLQETVPSTCENMGYDILICTACGRETIENFVDAYGHSFGPGETKDPTCTEYGCTRAYCYRCGETVERNFKDELGHDYQLLESVIPDCETTGYDKSECTRCGEILIENEVPAPGHTDEVIGEVITPTCTTEGFMQLHCTVCDSYRDQIIPASGHTYDDWSFSDTGMARFCMTCAEVDVILLEDLRITDVQSTEGENGHLIQISVGVDSIPDLLQFVICDYLNNGTLTYALVPSQGLVVNYTDAAGTRIELVRHFNEASTIVIPAE